MFDHRGRVVRHDALELWKPVSSAITWFPLAVCLPDVHGFIANIESCQPSARWVLLGGNGRGNFCLPQYTTMLKKSKRSTLTRLMNDFRVLILLAVVCLDMPRWRYSVITGLRTMPLFPTSCLFDRGLILTRTTTSFRQLSTVRLLVVVITAHRLGAGSASPQPATPCTKSGLAQQAVALSASLRNPRPSAPSNNKVRWCPSAFLQRDSRDTPPQRVSRGTR